MVLWFGSLGSSASEAVLWFSKVPETNSHAGPSYSGVAGSSTASALSVRQTPPLVAAIQSVQVPGEGWQSGEMTACAVRPPKFSVPVV